MKKVLVVEDDIVSRMMLSKLVESMGHIVIQSSDGRKALEVLRDNLDIDLLIADFMIPDLNGRELTRIIRSNEKYAELPIIIVSGVVKLKEISDVLELGASLFLPKPIDGNQLKEHVARLLEGEGQ